MSPESVGLLCRLELLQIIKKIKIITFSKQSFSVTEI